MGAISPTTPVSIMVDATGDLEIDPLRGGPGLARGRRVVAQRVSDRLRVHKGTFKFDSSYGFPWREKFLVHHPDDAYLAALLKRAILATSDVTRLQSFTYDRDLATRVVVVDFNAETPWGDISLSSGSSSTFIDFFLVANPAGSYY